MHNKFIWFALLGALGCAQPAPVFEVASIKPASRAGGTIAPGPASTYIAYGPERFSALTPLKSLIAEAYQIRLDMVSDIGSHNKLYQVTAKASVPAAKAEMREMLKTLLAERFQLSVRREAKPESVYRLVVRKSGFGLNPVESGERTGHWLRKPAGVEYVDATLDEFADTLTSYMQRPVLNETGIVGRYDFPFPQPAPGINEEGQAAILDNIQRYGLQMESGKASLDHLIVVRIEPVSEN